MPRRKPMQGPPDGPPSPAFQALADKAALTRRERDVASLAVRGYSNREIAQLLGIAADTVKEYLSGAFRKCGVGGRSELAAKVLGFRSPRMG